MMLADKILDFLKSLNLKTKLPPGVKAMNPYQDASAFELCRAFYNKFYNDKQARTLILGINPGRFGAGLTGIPFTDPVKLETVCGIKNDLTKKTELSAEFISAMLEAYGGAKSFYTKFSIS
ncbi:MAG: uracil-DNA glycosylase family protein, partial [Cyclobacteriaceae bacterium]